MPVTPITPAQTDALAKLPNSAIEAGCMAAWEVSRPFIAREFCGGKDPGTWAEQEESLRDISRQEVHAAYQAIQAATRTGSDALAKLAEIPAVGSEERDKWVDAAYANILQDGAASWVDHVNDEAILTLMSEARKQGQRDALGAGETAMSQAAVDVLAERRRQVEAEAFTRLHDEQHNDGGEICRAACSYAYEAGRTRQQRSDCEGSAPPMWPWDLSWWKPTTPRRDLVKAGALVLAEIERLDRASLATGGARHG
ncbi:hypothetical protein MKK88_07420 [Methylobacterium sp. E-005]|uniref:hypothetical protein n=1 Tax=Methylobacterium sp. E-005 TaxID=2836549 RepID=UPI001FBA9B41|nr:hypothetical protein [Methylobacterium sp. E-005]MCJ2085821.1 hypothetical protein [Methylobacterium sp. E-005]